VYRSRKDQSCTCLRAQQSMATRRSSTARSTDDLTDVNETPFKSPALPVAARQVRQSSLPLPLFMNAETSRPCNPDAGGRQAKAVPGETQMLAPHDADMRRSGARAAGGLSRPVTRRPEKCCTSFHAAGSCPNAPPRRTILDNTLLARGSCNNCGG
jgi:hypothetical protein